MASCFQSNLLNRGRRRRQAVLVLGLVLGQGGGLGEMGVFRGAEAEGSRRRRIRSSSLLPG